MGEWGSVLPVLLVFEALHKHCCCKGGIGTTPPLLLKGMRVFWESQSFLVGFLGQVTLTLQRCSPEGTCALLPSTCRGDWDHRFSMSAWKPHCCSFPQYLALTSLFSFNSHKWAGIFLSPCSLSLHCSHLLSTWDCCPFSFFPYCQLQTCAWWEVPQYFPTCWMPSAAGPSDSLSCSRQVTWAFPATFSINSIHPKHNLSGRGAKQPDDCCSWLQYLLEPY